MSRLTLGIVCFLLLAGCAEDICDGATLRAALLEAGSGDVVTLGNCVVDGPLVVPAGVTLRGADGSEVSAEASPVITLQVEAGQTTRLEGLRVRSLDCAAIVARGDGEAAIENVDVLSSHGIAVGVEGLSAFTVKNLVLRGSLADGEMATRLPPTPYRCDLEAPATHGLVMDGVQNASLESLEIRRFVGFGLLSVNSRATLVASTIEDNVGAGLEVYGGSFDVERTRLCGARQDLVAIESFNGLFAADAEVRSEDLEVCDSEVFGLFQDSAQATHVNLSVHDNGFAGVWAQSQSELTIEGAASSVERNRFAAVAAFGQSTLNIADTTLGETAEGLSLDGPTGSVRAADGLHLVDMARANLARLTLRENARIGLLADLAGAGTQDVFTLESIAVRAEGDALGAVAQNGDAPVGWDAEVDRNAIAAANDATNVEMLNIAGAVGPSCLPPIDDLVAGGLGALLP